MTTQQTASPAPFKRGFVVLSIGMFLVVATVVWWVAFKPDASQAIANCRGKIAAQVSHEQAQNEHDLDSLVGALADPARRGELPTLAADLAKQGDRLLAAQRVRDEFEQHPSAACPT